MFFGFFSPIIIKLKMNDLENVGSTSGKIYALATIGSLTGTFLGGFIVTFAMLVIADKIINK